jgi:repressor LexA
MEIKDLIKQKRNELSLTLEDVARAVGVSATTVLRWENGDIANMRCDKIVDLANVLEVSPGVIMGWDDKSLPSNIISFQENRRIPILGAVACDEPIWKEQNYEGYFITDFSIKADFCLYVKGDSMIDAEIYDGDIAFLKRTPTIENGSICAILIDDEATLKKVYKYTNSCVLQPCNIDYPPMVFDSSKDIMVLGKMVGVYHPTE